MKEVLTVETITMNGKYKMIITSENGKITKDMKEIFIESINNIKEEERKWMSYISMI